MATFEDKVKKMAGEEPQEEAEDWDEGEWADENWEEGDGDWAEEEDYEYNEDDWEEGKEVQEWDGDWDDEEYWDDEGGEFGYEGEDYIVKRVAMSGINRQKNCGVHTIEIYHPQFYFKQAEMEEWDSRPDRYGPAVIGKYTKGIGQIEARFPTDDEDPVSFCMTVVHRLVERMERVGFNETARFHPMNKTITPWHAFGRIDIGSESLIDRSKSMKSYVMDLFERYGDGEANIEGVDMYNACYGGQAAGLSVLNWIESDRWDGRYGLAIATDISDTMSMAMFVVGAACTGTLMYPDAPMAHTSHRASAILHRFDFFKPVGWKHMGPLTDGKYSVEAYMSCIDMCYDVLKLKMNNRPLFSISDYNVFHTGGGYHIVKKAFERFVRAEQIPGLTQIMRDELTLERLVPTCHLLKIIGPCHTVSSFLNMSSLVMSEWEKILGKVLIVFTYGSGAASTMYQVRFDDIPWFQPLAQWKIEFYRYAIYQLPSTQVHDAYTLTWMKFGYRPGGRAYFGIDLSLYEKDVYYLMEIDKYGRRYYHRGGVAAEPRDKKWELRADREEARPDRTHYGPLPQSRPEPEKTVEEQWKELEYKMSFEGADQEEEEIIQQAYERGKPESKIKVIGVKPSSKSQGVTVENDGLEHKYQIVGSWSSYKVADEMEVQMDGNYQAVIVMGENSWEEFFIIQDNDFSKRIYPAYPKSWKSLPCIGPQKAKAHNRWRIEARDFDGVPEEDLGKPGDQYLVMFSWKSVKILEWDKFEDAEPADYIRGTYHLTGSWTCWEFMEMEAVGDGHWKHEAQLTSLGLDFQVARAQDMSQLIVPDIQLSADGAPMQMGDSGTKVLGPDDFSDVGNSMKWSIPGELGDVFRIDFFRNPDALDELSLTWERIDQRPVQEPAPRYFLIGSMNGWGSEYSIELVNSGNYYSCEIKLGSKTETFQLLEFKRGDRCIHPDKKECTQMQAHEVKGPHLYSSTELCWCIGKAQADKARIGDTFAVAYTPDERRINWKKKQ